MTATGSSMSSYKSSEILYRTLFENASDGILLMRGITFIECNPRAVELFGCDSASELIGKTPVDFSPEYQPVGLKSDVSARRLIERAQEGKPISFEWLHARKDGTTFFSEINLSTMSIEEEEFILAFVRDISRRKQVENELIELQEYLQLQIEKMPVGQIVWDTDLIVKGWNPAAERIFGFTEEEVIGRSLKDLLVPFGTDTAGDPVTVRLLDGDNTGDTLFTGKRQDGQVIICRWTNTPLTRRDGEIIGVLSMVQDITEKQRAEEELKTYQNYLEDLVSDRTTELEIANLNLDEREKSVRLLSEITGASNLSDDPEEAIFFAIERMAIHAGWEFGQMVYVDEAANRRWSSGIWYFNGDHGVESLPQSLKECSYDSESCPVNMAIKSRNPVVVSHSEPYGCEITDRLVRKHGLFTAFAFPIEAEARIVGVIQFLLSKYISPPDRYFQLARQIGVQLGMAVERKRIGLELLQEKRRAEEASRTKSQFLANMSHEIRTPLNSILGFTDILSTKLKVPQNIKYLDSIRASSKTLLQLLNDILDLSKVEAGQLELSYTAIYISDLVEEIVSLYRMKAENKGINLSWSKGRDLPPVIMSDDLRLRQVLINLLSNAVKFTREGTVKLSVEAEPLGESRYNIRFAIADTGIGMSVEFQEKLFDTFRQEDAGSDRRYEGTGLGLAIAKRLVETLNGTISVESEKDRGTTFTIELFDVEGGDVTSRESVAVNLNPGTIWFENATVLLIDDNPDDCKYFGDLMTSSGLEVVVAGNGREALKLLADGLLPDLVLSDIRMPEVDGFEFITGFRSFERLKDIPVIAISASAMNDDIVEINNYSFDHLLLKPVTMNEFYSALVKYLATRNISVAAAGEMGKNIYRVEPGQGEKIRSIIGTLEDELMSQWELLGKKQPVDKVKEFATRLIALGESSTIENLRLYGEVILASIESFDIETLKRDLAKFPDLVTALKREE